MAAGLLVSVGIVSWQVSKQFKNNRKLQEERIRSDLRLKIYNEIDDTAQKLSEAEIIASNFVRTLVENLKHCLNNQTLDYRLWLVGKDPNKFNQLNFEVGEAHGALLGVLERYEVAFPDLQIFRTAFNYAHDEQLKSFLSLYPELLKVLPLVVLKEFNDGTDEKHIYQKLPNEELLNTISELGKKYIEANSMISDFIYDLRVESQNALLGELFSNKVKRRKPLDPSNIVIKTEKSDIERLDNFFHKETDWGRRISKIEEEVSSSFKKIDN